MQVSKTKRAAHEMKAKPTDESTLGFGRIASDHMFLMDYHAGKGWHDPRIVPYAPFSIDPAALVFHYGQEVFEGLKAYHGADGGVYLFRPKDNIQRMRDSCARLCIPDFDPEVVYHGLKELVIDEKDWIPSSPGTSLYIRPTVIATEACLGVKVSKEYIFFIIAGPVGAYYPEGFSPTKIYVEEEHIRAAVGGLGAVKTSANYAASLLAAEKAHAAGYTQVLWLDACDRKSIEEVGTSNAFFVINDQLITPPLGGSILPGITRDSVLKLARSWGLNVSEHKLTIDDVLAAQANGTLQEAFASGTAAVISPVGTIAYKGTEYAVADGKVGPVAQRLYDEIIGIQLGTRPDPFNWVVKVL